MFQVAPRPIPAHQLTFFHDDLTPPNMQHHSSDNTPASSNLQLPRTLARPPFVDINIAKIAAIAPELSGVPAEYIRRGLSQKAHQMLAGLASISHPPSISKYNLHHTTTLSLPIQGTPHASYPTHILALSSSSKSSAPLDMLPLIPTHSLVLAANCSSLPEIPLSSPTSPTATHQLTLPILPITVPSPAAFPTLHNYLYTHSLSSLLSSLIPLPQSFLASLSSSSSSSSSQPITVLRTTLSSGPLLHQLSLHLLRAAQSQSGESDSPLPALMSRAHRVTALWRNAAALGVFDPALWDALDLAWEVLLGAMNIAAGVV